MDQTTVTRHLWQIVTRGFCPGGGKKDGSSHPKKNEKERWDYFIKANAFKAWE